MINEIKKAAAKVVLAKEYHNNPELTKFRLKVCATCDRFDKENQQCGVCGCFMDLKAQLAININLKRLQAEITHCPLGRWGDDIIRRLYEEKN